MPNTYKNIFYRPDGAYGSERLSTDAKPIDYKGFQIFERIHGQVFDIVKNGVCVAMRAGKKGAKDRIDELLQPDSTAWINGKVRQYLRQCDL